jgi:site-specific DNA-methyltransferase (adenine-specific)
MGLKDLVEKSYYYDKDGVLLHGDCLEVMKEIPSGSVDLVLTDPPYGNMKGAELDGWSKDKTNWDVAIEPDKLFLELVRILRENGQSIIFSQEPYTSKIRTCSVLNFKFCYPMIWKKDHFANALIAKKAPVSYFEDLSLFVKKYDTDLLHPLRQYSKKILEKLDLNLKQINKILGHRKAEHFFYWNTSQFKIPTQNTYNELKTVFKICKFDFFIEFEKIVEINKKFNKKFNLPENKKYKSNIYEYKKDYEGLHPTQKPVLLLEDLIKTYTNENDLVLDCFSGSSSTLVACKNTKRKYIGIEMEEKYCEISKQRLEKSDGKNAEQSH